uniref:Uncharacterized protein orf143 n=1 Tax=Desmarestia viridis TaxID=62313 RepID=Q2TUF9_9PHAE|nr:hypothetical protein DevioMp15 [Desmarestia viridis]AAS79037.1 hypothetical protein [Desmarestia viridis]
MFTPRKRHLRKKRFFLPNQQTFALLNGSNLKASKLSKIKLSLKNGKLYSVPLYLSPPKIGAGCPLIMVVYENVEELQKNIAKISVEIDCLGISIDKKWYPINFLENGKTNNLYQKTLALLLVQSSKIKITYNSSERRDLNPQL